MEKKYPIGGYAPGNYECKCCICGNMFTGDKRAVQCEPCAVKDKAAFDALSPTEQEELIKRNSAIAHIMYEYAGSGDQIIANQVAGMPLEEAIFQAGYSSGYDNGYERGKKEAGHGAVWVKASEFKHEVGMAYHAMDSSSKGAGMFNREGAFVWGDGTVTWPQHREDLFILDESAADDWTSVDDQPPAESGRYWCYVEHLTDLGFSYFQWNCDYNAQLKRFSDMTLKDGQKVTHWRELPAGPKK